jgi:hypothetical protein
MDNKDDADRRQARVTINKEFESFDAFIQEYVTNISRTGAFIKSKTPLPIGTESTFTVIMDDAETRAWARSSASKKTPRNGRGLPGNQRLFEGNHRPPAHAGISMRSEWLAEWPVLGETVPMFLMLSKGPASRPDRVRSYRAKLKAKNKVGAIASTGGPELNRCPVGLGEHDWHGFQRIEDANRCARPPRTRGRSSAEVLQLLDGHHLR